MKSCDFYSMAGRQNTAIQMDTPDQHNNSGYVSQPGVNRSHSRSQSWSDPHGQRRQANLTSSITSMYSISPISSVIREFVPSIVQMTRTSDPTNVHLSGNHHNLQNRNISSSNLSSASHTRDVRYGDDNTERVEGIEDTRQDDDYRQDHWSRGDVRLNMDSIDRRHVHEQAFHDTTEQSTLGVEISEGVRWMELNAVFIILLLIKFSFYHRYGLMIILGMFGTYFHCNQTIRKQVALKNRRQISILILTVLFLASNIYFVYYVFWDQRIYNCLYFRAPHFTVDLMNLLWSIWVTDYIIRFATMALKALVAAFFIKLLPSSKKGKYYMLLEYGSQLYRSIIPTPLWVRYLSNRQPTGIVFAVVITATYLMIKGVVIFLSLRDFYRAVISSIKEPLYGSVCSKDEMSQFDSHTCPICQEDFNRPVTLQCRHVFCEECVLQWLDRQSSCPLCRAAVPNHNPKWRDGSTATWPQLF